MAHYINKDILISEIERRVKFFTEESGNSNSDIAIALFGLKSFLDTIDVKEVDFVKEFYTFSEKHRLMDKGIEFADIEKTASFFFQLGLKAAQNEHKSCTTDE